MWQKNISRLRRHSMLCSWSLLMLDKLQLDIK
jgi:hypothetical protein